MLQVIAICVLTASSQLAADESNSPTNSRLSHLNQAVQSLEPAGEEELAERVRQRMAEQQEAGRERLDKLRKQRDELTREIDRLTRELQQAAIDPAQDEPAVLMYVNVLRVDMERLRARHPELAKKLLTAKNEVASVEAVRELVDVSPPESNEPLYAAEVCETLRLPFGKKVTSFNGGELLIQVTQTAQESREIGSRITAIVQPAEGDAWQGELGVRHTAVNQTHAVKTSTGTSLPGFTTLGIQNAFTARLKEPQVFAALPTREQGSDQLWLVTILLVPEKPAAKETP